MVYCCSLLPPPSLLVDRRAAINRSHNCRPDANMEQQPDNLEAVCKEGQDNDTSAVLQAATQAVDALALGRGAEQAARAEGTARPENASAETTVAGAEIAASEGDTDSHVTEGQDSAASGDDTCCAKPCAEELDDERAVLQILYDT